MANHRNDGEQRGLHILCDIAFNFAGVHFLEDKTMNFQNNVKKGDIITTDVGSAVLLRETRARWFYLFKNKKISIRKSDFWEMVDTGKVSISYVESKKYRTKQRRHRTLDLTGVSSNRDHEELFEEFLQFVKPPFNIAYNNYTNLDLLYFIDKVHLLGLEYEIDRARFGITMFRVYDA